MENSQKENLIVLWIFWHFYEMPKFLFGVWKNYLLFGLNYFSVPLLAKTLFSPWRRYRWQYPRGFDAKEFFNTLISNTFSRFLGAILRVALIVIGILGQIVIFFTGFIMLVVWYCLPLVIIGGIFFFLRI